MSEICQKKLIERTHGQKKFSLYPIIGETMYSTTKSELSYCESAV